MNDLLTRLTADLILGVTWVIAWQQILYAEELPGDGFTAGVFMLVAVLLKFVVLGHPAAAALLPPRAFYWSAFGGLTLLAVLFLAPPIWGGAPLEHFYVPLGFGRLSSGTLFEVGVFLAIAGALVDALTNLPERTP